MMDDIMASISSSGRGGMSSCDGAEVLRSGVREKVGHATPDLAESGGFSGGSDWAGQGFSFDITSSQRMMELAGMSLSISFAIARDKAQLAAMGAPHQLCYIRHE